jgi:hypothetical protein
MNGYYTIMIRLCYKQRQGNKTFKYRNIFVTLLYMLMG